MADSDVPHLSQQLLALNIYNKHFYFPNVPWWRSDTLQSFNARQSGRQFTSLLQPDFCVQEHVCPRSGRSHFKQSLSQNYTCYEQLCVWAVCSHRYSNPNGHGGPLFQPGAGAQQFSTADGLILKIIK